LPCYTRGRIGRKGETVRCYLMREGHIHGVELLVDGSDEELIKQATMVLKVQASQGVDGVEVWSGTRFVYRHPPSKAEPNSN
jgi:hypothetical protein